MDVVNRYRESHATSSDEDSEDSDKECTVWKRATVKKADKNEVLPNSEILEVPSILPNNEMEEVPPPEQPKLPLKRKINTVWSDVLQDQLISEDLEDCLLKNKPRHYGSRGKESYDYTLGHAEEEAEEDSDSHMSDGTLDEENFKPQKRDAPGRKDFRKFVKLDSAELGAARKINKVLNEKKFYLIKRIVKYTGIEKAMSLLEKTKEIEENGGMLINSQTRRRTPGGVYIQQLKEDKEITSKMLDKIFEGEMSGVELKSYYKKMKKNQKKKCGSKKKKNSDKKMSKLDEMVGVSVDPMEPGEIIPMDSEITPNILPKLSYVHLSPSFLVLKTPPGHLSDLEEGEIED